MTFKFCFLKFLWTFCDKFEELEVRILRIIFKLDKHEPKYHWMMEYSELKKIKFSKFQSKADLVIYFIQLEMKNHLFNSYAIYITNLFKR
jgi:hypothetical protein